MHGSADEDLLRSKFPTAPLPTFVINDDAETLEFEDFRARWCVHDLDN